MTRILYMSDLHLDLEPWDLSLPSWMRFWEKSEAKHPHHGPRLESMGKVDLVILAGDIHSGKRGIKYADELSLYLNAPVCYIPGNHEFYHQYMQVFTPSCIIIAQSCAGRVYFLENGVASFNFGAHKINVLGCTLWTDYELNENREAAMDYAAKHLNDHVFISIRELRFTPIDALARHVASRGWLHETLSSLKQDDPNATNIVVTHHAPSPTCLGERTGEIAPAYASDLLAEFAPYAPDIWVHGHTHLRHDKLEQNIRIASAPRGYRTSPGVPAPFIPGIIEL